MPRLGVLFTRDAILSSYNLEIDEQLDIHLNNIISIWGEKCNISKEYLYNNYNRNWIHVNLEKLEIKKKIKEVKQVQEERYKENKKVLENENRCKNY